MFKNVSSRGTPVLLTDTFLTWEENAYSWVKIANLSPGAHTVRWEWYEPSGALYTQSEDLALQGPSPSYILWNDITLTPISGSGYHSRVEPSFDQPLDRTGSWQVKIYFDGALAITENFRVIKAPWARRLFGNVFDGEHYVAVDPVRNLLYVTNSIGEPPPWTFGDFTIQRPYRVHVFDVETGQLLRKMNYDFRICINGTLQACLESPDKVVVDSASGRVYVEACDLYSATVGSGNFIANPIGSLGGIVAGVAVNPTNGYIYVRRWDDGRVTVVGAGVPGPGTVTHLNLLFPGDTGDMAVNTVTNRVYLVGSGLVYVLDSSTNKIIATIPDVFAATEGFFPLLTRIAVNPETNRIYVTRATVSTERLTVIDGATNSVIATVEGIYGRVEVNPILNRIYVESLLTGEIRILDGYTNMLIDRVLMPSGISSGTGSFAFNPATHKIYFAMGVGAAYDDSLESIYVMSDEPGPGGVVINKVELNASKTRDTVRTQWVELYNTDSSPVDISGWTLTSTRPGVALYGLTAHIPPGTILSPGARHLVETLDPGEPRSWLARTREVITLRDAQGRLADWTPELTDEKSGGTPETWQRFPDGQNTRSLTDWVLR